jgi:UDPglucose--hexose-1-phosphate uridylyltransferase
MAELIDIAARRLDAILDAPMPYTFGWQLAPRGYEDSFHLHCIFQPMKRARDRMKYLASVEQFTGFYLVDLPPEDAADLLNGKTTA